jgi:cell division protease FtsH
MFVGVGAARVRDLFEQARQRAPAIIFIDEIDALGRARGAFGGLGGHDEKEQTLNQLLAELDGFDPSVGLVLLAATNRPEILDPALLRAGRFDRQVLVDRPDKAGRIQILNVHLKRVTLASDFDPEKVAALTPGFSGADLANLVNEAALAAARADHNQVMMPDFTEAQEKIVLGAARKIMLSEDDRRRTAYHEAGHALLGMLQGDADRVRKVSIIPRGRALGVTLQAPDADRYAYSEQYLLGRIVGALGGRAAEALVFGGATTGAQSDLTQATQIARNMVGRWGMSEAVGPVAVLPDPELEATPFGLEQASPATRELVDREVRRIADECYQRACRMLTDSRARLDALAAALLERETLDEADAYAAAGLTPPASD